MFDLWKRKYGKIQNYIYFVDFFFILVRIADTQFTKCECHNVCIRYCMEKPKWKKKKYKLFTYCIPFAFKKKQKKKNDYVISHLYVLQFSILNGERKLSYGCLWVPLLNNNCSHINDEFFFNPPEKKKKFNLCSKLKHFERRRFFFHS